MLDGARVRCILLFLDLWVLVGVMVCLPPVAQRRKTICVEPSQNRVTALYGELAWFEPKGSVTIKQLSFTHASSQVLFAGGLSVCCSCSLAVAVD